MCQHQANLRGEIDRLHRDLAALKETRAKQRVAQHPQVDNYHELQCLRTALAAKGTSCKCAKSKVGLLSMEPMLLGIMGKINKQCVMSRSHVETQ